MDDMIGELEREDARVYQIGSHPKYENHFFEAIKDLPPVLDQKVDEELTTLLSQAVEKAEEGAAALRLEERNAIGSNVCWQCSHRLSRRSLWKRLFLTDDETSYFCGATQLTEVADPVSGRIRWIERIRGMLGPQLHLVDTPHRLCIDLNPDGQCQMFNIAMAKKKKHRKE